MACVVSLNFFLLAGDNPPTNSKTNNAGINVGDRYPHPSASVLMDAGRHTSTQPNPTYS
jgi:hypothetical protein